MTIVIGLRCVDGVIIGSDSQQEFGRGVAVKRLNKAKIYAVEDRFAIAGAGTLAHIEKAIDAIELAFIEAKRRKGGVDLSENECVDAIEKSITAVYKEYNIDRSKFLGDPKERDFFNPILICAGLEKIDDKNRACLFIIHSEGVVEKIPDYATAGSGAAYAELLLKNYYSSELRINQALPLVIHTINEVKEIDPNCGGVTIVATVSNEGKIEILNETQVESAVAKVKHLLDAVEKNIIPKVLRGELDEEKLRQI